MTMAEPSTRWWERKKPMMLSEKKRIDAMTYEQMLRKVRFAPIGDRMFVGETGDYFMRVMAEKKAKLANGEHTAASKSIGWES